MLRTTVLEFKNYRYLKVVSFFTAIFLLIYWVPSSLALAFQKEWFGYLTGSIAGLMVLILLWYGMRKRNTKGYGSLRAWLSAHIYLGVALILVATLHSKFNFALNIHTLSYFLLLLVILTGFYGIYAYLRFPKIMHENLGGNTLDALYLEIANADKDLYQQAADLPQDIKEIIDLACQDPMTPNVKDQLLGIRPNCPMERAIKKLSIHCKSAEIADQPKCDDLLINMVHRRNLLVRVRTDVMYKARLRVWLYLHLPLSIGLMVALIAHVVFILMYR